MTRAEFFDNVTTWWELKDFCDDERCDICEDIYDEDGRDSYINDCLMDWARNDTWTELLARLEDIPTGYEAYRYDDYGEWEGLDDGDFRAIRDEVAEWVDEYSSWDDDEEEDEEEAVDEEDTPEEYVDPEDETPIEDEDCSFDELFVAGVVCVQSIEATARAEEEADEAEFDVFLSAV